MDRKLNCGRTLLLGMAALSLLAVRAQAENITWRSDLHQAAAESKKLQKPMLLEFTASWCNVCRKMEQTTFRDKSVCRQINGCFVPIKIDADKHQELMKAVRVEYLPTTIVVSPQLVVLKRIQGYHTAAQFRKQLGGICRLAKHESAGKPASRRKNIKPAVAAPQTKPPVPAFQGHCLVSLMDDEKVRLGSDRFISRYRGVTLFFSSAEYKKRFTAHQKKYWPVDNGNCTVTAGENHKAEAGNPKFAVIYKQCLWFFADAEHRQRFARKPESFPAVSQ